MVNKLKKLPQAFKDILKVASKQASSLGFKIYLVGGVTRDLILGKATFDLDIVVEGDATVLAAKLAQRRGLNFRRHHAFGTAAVYVGEHKIDFATARSEYYPHWGSLPKVAPAQLKEDLFRRDFTINAMAIGLNKADYGKLIDFYGGVADLKKGLIRVLHKESFLEDPTRILRAVRFKQRFSFKIDRDTDKLMRQALKLEALTFLHPHRLSDELILILKEEETYLYIKRLYELTQLSFLKKKMKMDEKDFALLRRIDKAVSFYKRKFKKGKRCESWLIYLGGMVIRLSLEEILNFFRRFGLKKVDIIRVLSMKENLHKIKRLNKKLLPHSIYQLLQPLSIESILFFYAYYPQKKIRDNIEYYLRELAHIRLKVKGEDLKKIDLKPYDLYSRLLQRLLYAKIDKGLKTKRQEIKEAKAIYRRLVRRQPRLL
ncbi:MAG: CCA tRNA nucleotidyltransferase [Candidatus Omnitrophota bacterium]|nr:MAG: CCA tRNA nucleotidyltransferase [Candidatus Omnitrophota bacterium]